MIQTLTNNYQLTYKDIKERQELKHEPLAKI